MNKLKYYIEFNAFGVCSYMAQKMGIAVYRTRLFFIYATFLTLGSPIIFYMIIAFWLKLKNYFLEANRNPFRNS
jgi:phage shock protein PspC (stress-responsive transcriptional regulator)